MRVLFASTNRLRVPQSVLPLGMCQVAASVESEGHDIAILDLCFHRGIARHIHKAIAGFGPDVVALSIRNLDNSDASCTRSYVADAQRIMDAVRMHHHGPVVIGGPAVSVAPNALLTRLGADFAFVGEGERTFPEFLDALDQGRTPMSDDGIIRCADACSLGMPPSPLPVAMLKHLDLCRYAAYGTPVPIQTRRGCALKCVYCTYPAIEGAHYRLKPPCAVAEEIEEASSLGTLRSAEFVDSTFNVPLDHAFGICEALEAKRNRMPLYTTSINPSNVSIGLFRIMERAGFTAIAASIESASDEVLSALKKGYTSRDVVETIRAARMTSMGRMWLFILGGPGETERTANETLAFIRKYMNDRDVVMITLGLRIYPGTELESIARREGILDGSEDLLEPTFYFSPQIGRERLHKLVRKAGLSSTGAIFISDIGSAILPVLQRVHTMMGMTPPYWRHSSSLIRLKRAFG